MSENTALCATYRVPTRDAMKQLVDRINQAITEGNGVRHWQSDNGKTVMFVQLMANSDEIEIVHNSGGRVLRHVETLCRDSFEVFNVWGPGGHEVSCNDIVPAWLERGEP